MCKTAKRVKYAVSERISRIQLFSLTAGKTALVLRFIHYLLSEHLSSVFCLMMLRGDNCKMLTGMSDGLTYAER